MWRHLWLRRPHMAPLVIHPEAASGKTELANVCLCCRSCNSYRGGVSMPVIP
jgi:hypothetical protein